MEKERKMDGYKSPPPQKKTKTKNKIHDLRRRRRWTFPHDLDQGEFGTRRGLDILEDEAPAGGFEEIGPVVAVALFGVGECHHAHVCCAGGGKRKGMG